MAKLGEDLFSRFLGVATAGALIVLLIAGATFAQEEDSDGEEASVRTIELKLTPRSPQAPIQRYSLYPPIEQQTKGNAAPVYLRAALLTSDARHGLPDEKAYWEQLEAWTSVPPDEIPVEKVREALKRFDDAMKELAIASRRERCDWDPPTDELDGGAMVLSTVDIVELRILVRVVVAQIRLNLAEQDIAGAIENLRTGMALGRNLGEGDGIVPMLVGHAVSGAMDIELISMLSLPNCPNLYWPLANLPDPRISSRNALESEKMSAYEIFPALLEVRQEEHDVAEYWKMKMLKTIAQFWELDETNQAVAPATYRSFIVAQAVRYRKELKEVYGYDANVVDKMSDDKLALLYCGLEYERIYDEQAAPLGLPYIEAKPFYSDENRFERKGMFQGSPLMVGELLAPATEAIHIAMTRTQMQARLMRTVEAIRDYAAKNKKLPAQLSDVQDLPVANNPFTGKPFDYEFTEEGKAILIGKPDNKIEAIRITIELR